MTAFHKQSRIMVYKSDLNYSTEVFMLLFLWELVCLVLPVVHTLLKLFRQGVSSSWCGAPGHGSCVSEPGWRCGGSGFCCRALRPPAASSVSARWSCSPHRSATAHTNTQLLVQTIFCTTCTEGMVKGFVPAPDPAGWPWTGPDLQHQHLHPEKKRET